VDLSKLNDDELALLERLIAKAEGRFAGDMNPAFGALENRQPAIFKRALLPLPHWLPQKGAAFHQRTQHVTY
jgi:hypothetical protein